MKWLYAALLAVLTLAVLAAAVWWSLRPTGFATPSDCMDAYLEALQEGDVAKYTSCLGEPLRSQSQESSSSSLRAQMREVRSWVQHEPVIEGPTATVDVDEVRLDVRRVPFRLERTRKGWLIVGIGPPKEITPPVRPGTHVNEAPEK